MGRWIHRLNDLDPDTRTAVCANCGPVRVWRGYRGQTAGDSKWTCAIARSAYLPQVQTRSRLGNRCERCGFVPEDPCQLDINHRDGHRTNGDPSNLETLCANCHRLFSKRQRAGWTFAGSRWVKP